MDNLEQLRIQMKNDPRVRKELEEYVENIAEEYLDTLTSFIGKGTKEILVPFQQLVVKKL